MAETTDQVPNLDALYGADMFRNVERENDKALEVSGTLPPAAATPGHRP